MPRYRVLETSYIGDRIVNAGDEINFDGVPGKSLEPADDAARKAKAAADSDAPDEAQPKRKAKAAAE